MTCQIIIFSIAGYATAIILGLFLGLCILEILKAQVRRGAKQREEKEIKEIRRTGVTDGEIAEKIDCEKKKWAIPDKLLVQPWKLGLAEGVFFTTLVAVELSTATIFMVAWIGMKTAGNWAMIMDDRVVVRSFRMVSLIGSLMSMFSALVGGLIIRAGISSCCW